MLVFVLVICTGALYLYLAFVHARAFVLMLVLVPRQRYGAGTQLFFRTCINTLTRLTVLLL